MAMNPSRLKPATRDPLASEVQGRNFWTEVESCQDERWSTSEWVLNREWLRELLGFLEFSSEVISSLDAMSYDLGRDAGRSAFVSQANQWVQGGQCEGTAEWRNEFQALMVVAGFPKMIRSHRSRGIPLEITRATAKDLERHLPSGGRGFCKPSWLANHVHHGLLEIGRLQYLPGPYEAPYRVYTSAEHRTVHVFAKGGLQCSEDGWLDRGADSFVTVFNDDGSIFGNPVELATGRILRQPIRLEADGLSLCLDPESLVLHVHIPAGSKLKISECEDSLKRAAVLFGRAPSEKDWRAFCCTSWLLDRELAQCLPNSNIPAFGRMFFPTATPNATADQLFERVLDGTADWRSFQPRTQLQSAVLDHLRGGGDFRKTSGFILRQSLGFLAASDR